MAIVDKVRIDVKVRYDSGSKTEGSGVVPAALERR